MLSNYHFYDIYVNNTIDNRNGFDLAYPVYIRRVCGLWSDKISVVQFSVGPILWDRGSGWPHICYRGNISSIFRCRMYEKGSEILQFSKIVFNGGSISNMCWVLYWYVGPVVCYGAVTHPTLYLQAVRPSSLPLEPNFSL